MRKGLVLLAMAVTASAAFAQTGGPESNERAVTRPGPSSNEPKENLIDTILGHVADSHELEFVSPNGAKYVYVLPTWRIAFKAGACPANVEEPALLSKGCLDISITRHVVMMWLAGLTLLIMLLLGTQRNKNELVPRGVSANLFEILVLFVRNDIAVPNIGKKEAERYVPYLLSIFFFILFMNCWGILPWMATPTGNLAVTGGLAICTFLLTEIASIRSAGIIGYLKHLDGGAPWWLAWMMIPIEILSKFTKPFALTVRLFANMIAGHIGILALFGLIFILKTVFASAIAVPFALFFYLLEIFVAFIQAYIFCILSAVFIGMGVAMGHHHGEHSAEAHGHPGEQLGA